MIHADIQWRERYVSHALNRKFAGIIPTGIYQGFACRVSGNSVVVGEGDEPGAAILESNGYSITVRLTEPESVGISASRPYLVIEAYYGLGIATRASLKMVASPEPGHVVLCRVDRSGSNWLLDFSERSIGRTERVDTALAQAATAQIEQMSRYLALKDDLAEEAESTVSRFQSAEALARQLDHDTNGRIDALASSTDEQVAALASSTNERIDEAIAEQSEINGDALISLTKSATASIDTMTRQVGMLDRLIAVEKAARI